MNRFLACMQEENKNHS